MERASNRNSFDRTSTKYTPLGRSGLQSEWFVHIEAVFIGGVDDAGLGVYGQAEVAQVVDLGRGEVG